MKVNRTVAPDVDLKRVKPGDRVTVKQISSVSLFVSKRTAPTQPKGRTVVVDKAEPGQKPGRLTVDTEEISATVAAIEPTTRTVTLRNPDGSTRAVQVESRAKLDKIDIGDQVTLRLTKAVVLGVESSK